MVSKEISLGVGIPMIVVGTLIAVFWASAATRLQDTIEFVGALIGIIGVVFLISGFFYSKEYSVQPSAQISNKTNEKYFEHYCVKCKIHRRIINPQEVFLKNGRAAVKGNCSECGIIVFRMGKMPEV